MKIVNPLYDTAFKYLMDNEQIAKSVLSILLDQSIVSLQSKPTELSVISGQHREAARYDFKAIIRTPQNEEKSVLIELQKYKTPNPIGRFRDYLAENYKKEETIINLRGEEETRSLPIITIYILGYNITKTPVLAMKIDRVIKDIIWDELIVEQPDFVDLLNHTSIIIQVDANPLRMRNTRLERFIRLFSQKLKHAEANYMIELDAATNADTAMDADLATIVDCLNRATLDESVLRSLKYEQSLADGILGLEREVADLNVLVEQAEEKIKLVEHQAQLDRKEREAAEEQAKAAEEQAKAAEEQAFVAKQALAAMVKKLHAKGFLLHEIAEDTGLSEKEIELILSR